MDKRQPIDNGGGIKLIAATTTPTNDGKEQQQNLAATTETRTDPNQPAMGVESGHHPPTAGPQQQQQHAAVQKRKWAPLPAAELMAHSKFRKQRANQGPGGGAGGVTGLGTAVNVRDPLNLGSVRPDSPNDPNFAKPIEILPADVNDPLNLQNLPPPALLVPKEAQLQRKRKRHDPDEAAASLSSSAKRRFSSSTSKPREKATESREQKSGSEATMAPSTSSAQGKADEAEEAQQKRMGRRRMMAERYRYGNFNHYRVSKNAQLAMPQHPFSSADPVQDDPRARLFCPDWFQPDVAVLDIGCGAGAFALSLARAFQPRRVVGVDIDAHLVGAARKNIRHMCDKDTKIVGKFPASFGANFGPVSAPCTSSGPHFPDNIWFFCENYVLPTDSDLETVHEEFDLIFALACIKWVHLNWADAGIKRFFHRVFRQLRTGGRFVLETAPFKDYRKHCAHKGADRPPDEVLRNFDSIRFHPDEFTAFLLNTVGFSHHEELDSPHSKALGISGRLQVFYKGKFMLDDAAAVADDEPSTSSTPTDVPPPPT